ncbi:MAG: histidine kinase N-terminal 7TM domain-containing protein [Chloroflexota bacterium]|nr:histidine kinase N-terminal 7TM domain-containing protein [Chloroflexota bacterium]
MYEFVIAALRNLNDLLTAGIAITAFSLLLYALSFNLRNRVARSFAFIMFCVVVIFVSEAMSSLTSSPDQIEIWLRLQWLGIVFLPPAYLHLSDAILATTGRPSRGRRRMAVRVIYLISLAFLLALPFSLLVGPLDQNAKPVPHLQLTWLTIVFAFYYSIVMLVAWGNLWRARNRTKASASNRRMIYLLAGSLAPAIGSFPFLLFGSGFASDHPLIFWLTVNLINILVTIFLILMAYSVAYFGVPWPDRVVKRRLFKWLLRGPFTASTTLALTTLVVRAGWLFGLDLNSFVPAVMVTSIVTIEHLITLISPTIERLLFRERDQADMELLQSLEDRLLTRGDLKQFLEAILNAACDRLQTPNAFIATLTRQGIDMFITIGGDSQLDIKPPSTDLLEAVSQNGLDEEFFIWGDYWLIPIFDEDQADGRMLGLLGIHHQTDQKLDTEQVEALRILTERAGMALRDRRRQQQAFSSLEALTPQMDMIQQWRATARYDGTEVLSAVELPIEQKTLSVWVKDALTHYWGGPKLTQSPLIRLQVVQKSLEQYDENPTNTLRAVLRQAIDQVRPEGERRFTGEWILYNILEMKFMEGRKVRDVAMRLAMSEADLYRKQRVAIEAVTDTILTMEQQARQEDAQNADGNKHMLNS